MADPDDGPPAPESPPPGEPPARESPPPGERSARESPPPGERSATYRSRTALLFAVSEILGKLASFGMFAVASRVLGPDGFGQYSWALALAAVVASFGMFGFDMAQIQLGERHRDRVTDYLTSSVLVRLLIAVAGVGVVLLMPIEDPSGRTLLVLLTIALSLENVSAALRAAAATVDRQRGPAALVIVQRLVTAVVSIAALLMGYGVLAMGAAFLLGTALGTVGLWIVAVRIGVPPGWRRLHVDSSLALLRRSILPGLANTMNMQTTRGPILGLERTGNGLQVGYFAAAFKLIETSLFVSESLVRTSLPPLLYAPDERRVAEIVRGVLAANAAFYFPVAAALALRGADLLALLFGPDFAVAGPPAVLAWALLAWVTLGPLTTALLARHHSRDVAGCAAVAMVTMFATVGPAVDRWEATGAAVSLAAAFTVQAAGLWWRLARRGARPRMGASLVPALLGCAAMTPVALLVPPILLAAAVGAVVYGVVWWLAAHRLDPASVGMLRSVVRR